MCDNGFPLATESNILMEMIRPPSLVDAIIGKKQFDVTYLSYPPPSCLYRVSDTLPTGQITQTPWRRTNVKYGSNGNTITRAAIALIDLFTPRNIPRFRRRD